MLQSKSLCGVTLQYNIEGDGYPVILMHGWGCNHTTVQSIERLLSPHFKVYNLDFPGFGGDARIMEKLIPDAGLVAFDDAGHYSFLDKPYEFNTVLQNFLQDDIKRKS